MCTRVVVGLYCILMLSVVANGGDNFIKEWSGAGAGYTITQGLTS